MCLTVPRKVTEVKKGKALLQDGRWVTTTLVGEVKTGEMLLVNANVAFEKITHKQAMQMKKELLDS